MKIDSCGSVQNEYLGVEWVEHRDVKAFKVTNVSSDNRQIMHDSTGGASVIQIPLARHRRAINPSMTGGQHDAIASIAQCKLRWDCPGTAAHYYAKSGKNSQ